MGAPSSCRTDRPASASYSDRLHLPRETRSDRLTQPRDDDPFLAGLHRLGVDHDAVGPGARTGWLQEKDARIMLLQREHELMRIVESLQHPLGLGPPQRGVCVVIALHIVF